MQISSLSFAIAKRAACCIFLISTLVSCKQNDGLPNHVRVGYLPMVSSLTYFIAAENRYFIEEGLDVEATPIKTSNGIAQDLATGNIDAAIELSVVPLLKTIEADVPKFKIFSTSKITVENGFDGILVKADSKINSLQDLSGKKVGTFPGATAINIFTSVFSKEYPNKPLPIFVPIDPSRHIQNLASGDVDALHAYEPALTIGIVKHGFKKIEGSIYGRQFSPSPIGVAAVNADWLNKNTDTAKAFIRAIDRAVQFIENHSSEARDILAKYTGTPKEVTNTMNIMPMSLSTNVDYENLKTYVEMLTTIQESPEIKDAKALLVTP